MSSTRVETLRRRMTVTALCLGPVLVVLSVAIDLAPPGASMRADFDAIATRGSLVVAGDLLETLGFLLTLAGLAGAALTAKGRGGVLGSWAAAACLAGIAGFAMSNAQGLVLSELAALPDRDAAFATAVAVTGGGVAGLTGTLAFGLELVGQLGLMLAIGALVRAARVPWWLLLVAGAGIALNAVIGTMLASLVADVLLVGVCGWVAVAVAGRGTTTRGGVARAGAAPLRTT